MPPRNEFRRLGGVYRWQGRHPLTGARMNLTATSRAELVEQVAQIQQTRASLRSGRLTRAQAARALGGAVRSVFVRDLWAKYEAGLPDTSDGLRSAWAQRVEPTLGGCEVWELTEEKMRIWWRERCREYAPKSVKTAFDALRGAYRIAIATGELPGYPWGAWRAPAVEPARPRESAVTIDEVVSMLEPAARADAIDRAAGRYAQRAAVLAVLFLTGARQAEAAALGWDAVRIDEQPWTLSFNFQARRHWWKRSKDRPRDTLKGKRRRTQSLHPSLAEILRGQRAELERWGAYRDDGPILPGRVRVGAAEWSKVGRVIKPSAVRKFARAAGLPGWENWSTHSTRHSFATLELMGSGDAKATMQRTGHRSMNMLEGYIRAGVRGVPQSAIPELPLSVLPALPASGVALEPPAPLELPPAPPLLPPAGANLLAVARAWVAEDPDADPLERPEPQELRRAKRRAYGRAYTAAKRAGLEPEARRDAADRAVRACHASFFRLVSDVRKRGG